MPRIDWIICQLGHHQMWYQAPGNLYPVVTGSRVSPAHVFSGGESELDLKLGLLATHWMVIVIVGLVITAAALIPEATNARSMAATLPTMGTAATYAVLAGSTITNTGPTTLTGDLGLHPGTAVVGAPVVSGTSNVNNAVALQAKNDLLTAFNALDQPCDATIGPALAGLVLTPGTYCFSSGALLSSGNSLTLNFAGNPNAVFIFKVGSALTIESGTSVVLTNAGANSGCNVFWRVVSSATLGTTSAFVGSILASTSISLATGARVQPGRVLASTGAVTFDTNIVTAAVCASVVPTPTAGPGTPTATTGPGTPTATAGPGTPTVGPSIPTPAAGPSPRCIGNVRGAKLDGSNAGLAGWTIRLIKDGEVIRSTVTDGSGAYEFLGIDVGTYTVEEVLQPGWVADTLRISVVVVFCDQNVTSVNFVNRRVAATATPSVAATVAPSPAASPRPEEGKLPTRFPQTGGGEQSGEALLLGALLLSGVAGLTLVLAARRRAD